MQLAASHEHGTDLGELAKVAAESVGLGVERHELGAGDILLEQLHRADTNYAAGRME